MSRFICKKACYRGSIKYKVGDVYRGDMSRIPSEFVSDNELVSAKKALTPGASTLHSAQTKQGLSKEAIAARRAVGHKTVVKNSIEHDPFEENTQTDDDFLS